MELSFYFEFIYYIIKPSVPTYKYVTKKVVKKNIALIFHPPTQDQNQNLPGVSDILPWPKN